jgi:hypothetical protein
MWTGESCGAPAISLRWSRKLLIFFSISSRSAIGSLPKMTLLAQCGAHCVGRHAE